MIEKASGYEILDDNATLLLNGSGLFALSNGDAVEAVTHDLNVALTQTDFEYVDAFPKAGGGRAIAVKCVGQQDGENGPVNVWTSNF